MLDCKPASTPLEPNVQLTLKDSLVDDNAKARMEQFPYRQVVGKYMYLAVCTRPDICQAVSELGGGAASPSLPQRDSRSGTALQAQGVCRHLGLCRRESHQLPQTATREELPTFSCLVEGQSHGLANESGMGPSAHARPSTWD